MEPALDPALEPVAFLLGTWRGEGKGTYPTAQDFSYLEEISFRHIGKPFLIYTQRTTHPVKGFPMHAELGYWRPQEGGRIELVLAHPTGIVEIEEGTIDGTTIEVATTHIGKTTTAKEVSTLERTFTVDGDVLRYEVRMAAVGVPLTSHLTAELKRAE
ncbi:MAG TPA: FABP family protein [Actinomycetota bacterium]|nr:FABP family protein [Actinomycetota bacterium]